jgi:hypothetical protein
MRFTALVLAVFVGLASMAAAAPSEALQQLDVRVSCPTIYSQVTIKTDGLRIMDNGIGCKKSHLLFIYMPSCKTTNHVLHDEIVCK